MLKLIYIFIFICLSAFSLTDICIHEIQHKLTIIHKGVSEVEPLECVLVEVKDERGLPSKYYMDVESVVCGDSQCRIDLVRVYWNEIGKFQQVELPDDVELEKSQGESFTSRDYKKLRTILKNEESPLADVYKTEIVGTTGSEGVDAMTGATILIDTSSYVSGAVWTCYSLWHWVHGEAKHIARNITGEQLTLSQLREQLARQDYQSFAIEQLLRKQDFSSQTVNVLKEALLKSPSLLKESMAYWEAASDDIYNDVMMIFMSRLELKERLLCLNSMVNSNKKLSNELLLDISEYVTTFSYSEFHVFLRLIEKMNSSAELVSNLVPLLSSDDFLIARRVYWFLNEQSLCEADRHRVENFRIKWRDRL